jgi:mannose-1-phosphate guanylyltransferase
VLAGGVGSRFWPVSRPDRPKQLLPLGSERPLIEDTIERILPLVPRERLRLLTGERLAAPILAATPALDQTCLWIEPRARGTAPVLAWAAALIAEQDPDAVMLSLHADHIIDPPEAFRSLLEEVAGLAREHGRLFTIGIEPVRPETGYGYIRLGAPLAEGSSAFEVAQFVEKPDLQTARKYVLQREYLWNSGIFGWRVADLLEEIERHTPELASLLPLARAGRTEEFFDQAPNLSIDEGLLERSGRVGVVRATFRWDDVGAWEAVARNRATDEAGNVVEGDAHLVDAEACVAWAEEGTVVLFGTRDLVVVQANGVTFVAPRERTAELKELLRRLPETLRNLER